MTMEFSVGRASQKSAACSFHVLEKPGQKWHFHSYLAIVGMLLKQDNNINCLDFPIKISIYYFGNQMR